MKLITKFLTTLTPIAIVGTITPTIVSCGCSGKEYKIEYGDDINCKDKKDKKTYKKVAKVQEAITKKIQVETNPEKVIDISDLNDSIKTDTQVSQNIYYEFVYYHAFLNKDGFKLSGWTGSWDSFGFTFNDMNYSLMFSYKLDENNSIFLHTSNDTFIFRSHTYEHCKGKE